MVRVETILLPQNTVQITVHNTDRERSADVGLRLGDHFVGGTMLPPGKTEHFTIKVEAGPVMKGAK